MIDLLIAMVLAQGTPPDPCNAVAQTPAPAGCPAWRRVYDGAAGEVFTDPATLRRTGNLVEIRTRTLFRENLSSGMRSAVAAERYDCGARTYTLLRLTAFDAAGVTLMDQDTTGNPRAGPMTLSPGSPNDAVFNAVCS